MSVQIGAQRSSGKAWTAGHRPFPEARDKGSLAAGLLYFDGLEPLPGVAASLLARMPLQEFRLWVLLRSPIWREGR